LLDKIENVKFSVLLENSQEVMKKAVFPKSSSFSFGKDIRRIDFTKYASTHEELVQKGIY
jgi:hypothetical protein